MKSKGYKKQEKTEDESTEKGKNGARKSKGEKVRSWCVKTEERKMSSPLHLHPYTINLTVTSDALKTYKLAD